MCHRKIRFVFLELLLVVLCTLINFHSRCIAAELPAVRVIRVPDNGIFPQAQVDGKGNIHLTYFKGDAAAGDLFYVKSSDAGASFSKPMRVNSQTGSVLTIGTVRGPQMAVGKDGRVHAAWFGSNDALPKANGKTPLLFTRLNDAGDSFEEQRNAITEHVGLDGGGSIAADSDGHVYLAWHAPDGQPGEEHRKVWLIKSNDGGKTFGPEKQANPDSTGACGCCGMKIFAMPNSHVAILYRTATEKVHRDTHLLISKNDGESFSVAITDEWNIGICAMSTFAMGSNADRLVAAWETQQQIKLVRRTGDIFSKPITVPGRTKNQKHPSVAVAPDGQFLVAWAEGTGWQKGGALAWQLYNADGTIADKSGRAEGLPMWSLPSVVMVGDQGFCVIY